MEKCSCSDCQFSFMEKMNVGQCWDQLDVYDREIILEALIDCQHSNIHMGMLPLVSLSTVMKAIERTIKWKSDWIAWPEARRQNMLIDFLKKWSVARNAE